MDRSNKGLAGQRDWGQLMRHSTTVLSAAALALLLFGCGEPQEELDLEQGGGETEAAFQALEVERDQLQAELLDVAAENDQLAAELEQADEQLERLGTRVETMRAQRDEARSELEPYLDEIREREEQEAREAEEQEAREREEQEAREREEQEAREAEEREAEERQAANAAWIAAFEASAESVLDDEYADAEMPYRDHNVSCPDVDVAGLESGDTFTCRATCTCVESGTTGWPSEIRATCTGPETVSWQEYIGEEAAVNGTFSG
jgi:TolA-binding protein